VDLEVDLYKKSLMFYPCQVKIGDDKLDLVSCPDYDDKLCLVSGLLTPKFGLTIYTKDEIR